MTVPRLAVIGILWLSAITLPAFTADRIIPLGDPNAEETPRPFFAMDTAIRSLDHLDDVREIGYDGISWRFEPGEELSLAVERVRKAELELFAVYGSLRLLRSGLVFPDDLESRLRALEGTGAALWVPIYSPDFASSDPAGDEVILSDLRRLADLAASHDLRVALFPYRGAWIERLQDATRVAAKVRRENLGVTFNLAHCLMVGDESLIPSLLEEARPHLFFVTVNGTDRNSAGSSWRQLIQPLDRGSFDLAPVLEVLDQIRYRGPVGLQGFGIDLPPPENLRRSIERWRELNEKSESPAEEVAVPG